MVPHFLGWETSPAGGSQFLFSRSVQLCRMRRCNYRSPLAPAEKTRAEAKLVRLAFAGPQVEAVGHDAENRTGAALDRGEQERLD